MSKAVLVMDMPERCDKCPLLLKLPQKDGLALCLARQKNGAEDYNPKHEKTWKPDWCPLRELPEKMEVCGHYPQPDGVVPSYKIGWNACLEAITRESEEK